jgi:GT2 family glycosyltransferase
MEDVFFICVNYNNSHFTIKYIESVLSLNNIFDYCIKIVVVDNNSKESDYTKINNFTKDIRNVYLIRNTKNSGYFNGLNLGMELIKKEEVLFAIIGNNDLEFDEHFLHELNLFKNRSDNMILAIAPNIINLDGDTQNPVSINRLSFLRRLFLKVYFSNYSVGLSVYWIVRFFKKILKKSSKKHSYEKMEINLGYGACYVLTRYFFNYFSKLDDSIFLYGEEALLGNQIRSVEGVMIYLPDLIVHHFEHATSRNIESKANYKITQDAYHKYKVYL